MKNNTLILITILYLFLSLLFNYGLYRLLIINDQNDQYFLIFFYFLSEIITFFFFLIPKSKDKIISNTLGPIILNDQSIDISMISGTDNNLTNNLTTSLNVTDTRMSSMQQQPFIGMKFISFLIPSIFDFLSKFFIYNGIKIIGNEIIFRSIIQLCSVFFLSKLFLKSKYNKFSMTGVIVILLGLIFSFLYCQISQSIELYFAFDSHGTVGMILCVIGEIFSSIQIFFQMKYFKIGEKYCYREVAWEGLFGLIISFVFFELSLLIPCPNKENTNNDEIKNTFFYCYKDSDMKPFKFLLNNIKNNIVWNIIYFIISIFYNLIGAILAKYIGEVYRSAVDAGRISIILYLILFIHTKNINLLDVILSSLFMVIILFGIVLSIFLRKQKDITFDTIPLDKSYSQDLSLIVDENNSNINESDMEL